MDKALLKKLIREINSEDALEAMGFSIEEETSASPVISVTPITAISSWYDLDDSATREYIEQVTPCFGLFSKSDTVCLGCPLASSCRVRAETDKLSRASERAETRALKEALIERGIPLKGLKGLPSHKEEIWTTAKDSCICEITDTTIHMGDEIYHAPGVGVILAPVARYMQSL